MKNIKQRVKSSIALTGAFILALGYSLMPAVVNAAQVTDRSLTLGSSAASATTTHKFDFDVATTANVGSIRFEYCDSASGACSAPTGLDVDGVSISAQSGATGFSLDGTETDANNIVITKTAASVTAGATLSYTFASADNPSDSNTTFYVRITTYTGEDGATGETDTGVVAASTANQITVTASVDETLTFCVYTGANCAAGGSSVDLGSLSSSALTGDISKMDAGTNATGGYIIQYQGSTLTSGGDTITAIGATAATSSTGTAQFGINATGANTSITGSAAPSGGSGTASSNYNTANSYAFAADTLTQIASASGPTDSTTFTVSYMANIGSSQAAGAYSTTITYICTGTF